MLTSHRARAVDSRKRTIGNHPGLHSAGVNGRQVADAARVSRPHLRILFITGYAENAVVGNGHLEPGMEIMTKPFVIATLGNRIRDLLARPATAK